MKQLYLKKTLPLLVRVQAAERIEKVSFHEHPEGLACEILGNPSRRLTKEITLFFEQYLSGSEVTLPSLDWKHSTPYTRTVLHCLHTIPRGETRTYAQIAKAIGSPEGARAVGGACGRNPFPFFLPCHRVIASSGIGGFSCGLHFKQALLEFESVRHA